MMLIITPFHCRKSLTDNRVETQWKRQKRLPKELENCQNFMMTFNDCSTCYLLYDYMDCIFVT
jgi:hypothetical protein